MSKSQNRYFNQNELVARTTSADMKSNSEQVLGVSKSDQQTSLFYNQEALQEIQSFQESLGAPALSNFFKVTMDLASSPPDATRNFPGDEVSGQEGSKLAGNLDQWLTSAGVLGPNDPKLRYEMLCNTAMLPGTSMSVSEEIGSRQGIKERFAVQREYTDISLGFYVSSDYKILKLFQEWMNYMNPLYVGQQGVPIPTAFPGGYPSNDESYAYHRFRYPDQYKKNLSVTKFERNLGTGGSKGGRYNISGVGRQGEEYKPDAMTYVFVNAFPISIEDIPLNYQAGQVLDCQVQFTYDRYYIVNSVGTASKAPNPTGGELTQGNSRQPDMSSGKSSSGRFLQKLNAM
tara:strand:+ start:4206 stop:5240 length:1035 start_codon:yes stop_codon:yes gene_type:complete